MSLQAKIEAVIYASEEPVTLPQLMGLLGEEAQAELNALESLQTSLALESEPLEEPAGEAADHTDAEVLDEPRLAEEMRAAEVGDADSSAAPRNDKSEGGASSAAPPNRSPGGDAAEDTAGAAAEERASTATDDKKVSRERERRLREYFRSLLDRLIGEYANGDRGLEIREVAGGFRMATRPEYHDAVRGFVKSLKPPMKLSLQALETLAVIAYKQPVTAPEISEIRGVESGGVLGTLLARKLIGTAGRKAVIGRPILYKTTKEFLLRFGLKDIHELPSIEEFEKMAGELNELMQEEIPMDDSADGGNVTDEADLDQPAVGNDQGAAPERASGLQESAEEMMTDHASTSDSRYTEPSAGASADAARAVEQMADVHEPQADGDSTPTEAAQQNPGDDAIVDGRISGIAPKAGADDIDNPSAREAAEQAAGGGGD